jgi:hypothetical protein
MSDVEEFWPTRRGPLRLSFPVRIPLEEFEALPTKRPRRHHSWRELEGGRWVVRYEGSSCGQVFETVQRPILTVRAAT